MFLKTLCELAQRRRLFEGVHLQQRPVHLVIPINLNGELVGMGLLPLTSKNAKGVDVLGAQRCLPRCPGVNNGGKSYFLADSCTAVLGINQDSGEGIQIEDQEGQKVKNPGKKFNHFWAQVEAAYATTSLPELDALRKFKARYLVVQKGKVAANLVFLELRQAGKEIVQRVGQPDQAGKKAEAGAKTSSGGWEKLAQATFTFQVDGQFVFSGDPAAPLAGYWQGVYGKEAFSAKDRGVCLVTGAVDVPIARSHTLKLLKIPGLVSGGYLISFAQESPAFSSFGLTMGENAPISENAASSYALALQALLDGAHTSLRMGPTVVCFWRKNEDQRGFDPVRMMTQPDQKSVTEFLKTPWTGIERRLAKTEAFYSVTLSGNAGRVVVCHWMQQTVEQAVLNLTKWFQDLAITQIGNPAGNKTDESPSLAIFHLACSMVRKAQDLPSGICSQLCRAALENHTPSLMLIKLLLQRLQIDLQNHGNGVLSTPISGKVAAGLQTAKQPSLPSGMSRFSLLKLILNRNRKEGEPVMGESVCQTNDTAYNCGRLLAVFDDLQYAAHKKELQGPGVVERYYGTASAAPNTVFGILWRLHQHHLRMLSRQENNGRAAATAIKHRIGEIAQLFSSPAPGQPPSFPRTFTLVEQGRFALGFYQQKAASDAARHEFGKQEVEAVQIDV